MMIKVIHAYCHKLKKQRRNKKSTHNPRTSPFKTRRTATQTVDVFNEQELFRRVTLSFNRAASCAEHSPLCCLLHGSSNSKPVTKWQYTVFFLQDAEFVRAHLPTNTCKVSTMVQVPWEQGRGGPTPSRTENTLGKCNELCQLAERVPGEWVARGSLLSERQGNLRKSRLDGIYEWGRWRQEERRRPRGQPVGRPEVGASYLRGSGERARWLNHPGPGRTRHEPRMLGKEQGQNGWGLEVHVLVRGLPPKATRSHPMLVHGGRMGPLPWAG